MRIQRDNTLLKLLTLRKDLLEPPCLMSAWASMGSHMACTALLAAPCGVCTKQQLTSACYVQLVVSCGEGFVRRPRRAHRGAPRFMSVMWQSRGEMTDNGRLSEKGLLFLLDRRCSRRLSLCSRCINSVQPSTNHACRKDM